MTWPSLRQPGRVFRLASRLLLHSSTCHPRPGTLPRTRSSSTSVFHPLRGVLTHPLGGVLPLTSRISPCRPGESLGVPPLLFCFLILSRYPWYTRLILPCRQRNLGGVRWAASPVVLTKRPAYPVVGMTVVSPLVAMKGPASPVVAMTGPASPLVAMTGPAPPFLAMMGPASPLVAMKGTAPPVVAMTGPLLRGPGEDSHLCRESGMLGGATPFQGVEVKS